jgi:hypothetical protein
VFVPAIAQRLPATYDHGPGYTRRDHVVLGVFWIANVLTWFGLLSAAAWGIRQSRYRRTTK